MLKTLPFALTSQSETLNPQPQQYIWEKDIDSKFEEALVTPCIQTKIATFLRENPSQTDNEALYVVYDILKPTATVANIRKVKKSIPSKKTKSHKTPIHCTGS